MASRASLHDVTPGPTLEHSTYLGASDVAAVLGLHPYKTALDVWAAKVHHIEPEDSDPMRAGRVLERPILEGLYAPPRKLSLCYPGTLLHCAEPWMGATPDALAGPQVPVDEAGPADRSVECKVVGARQMRRWGAAAEGPDGIPAEVLAQATWQLCVLESIGAKLETCDVPALLGTELRVYQLAYDPAFAANLMEVGRAWWKKHVEGGVMPEVYSDDTRRILAKIHPKPVDGLLAMREDVRSLIRAWQGYELQKRAAEALKDEVAAKLCAAIGTASGFEGDGLKVTWLPRRGQVSYKAIVDELGVPEAEREKYRGDSTRVLRVTGGDDDE